jgi:predicted nucleic acid-binding protein
VSFIDTNVLVYATAQGAPFRDRAAGEPLSISRQLLREYIAVMTRPQTWGKPLSLTEATADAVAFSRHFTMLGDGAPVWDRLMELSRRYSFGGRQVHDANVVATMLAYGERRLQTFNEADFRRFSALIEVVTP